MYNVLIRPLKVEDAQISWKWRNDPEVWKFTGSKPNVKVTFEIENEWILKVLEDSTSKRFAIIVDGKYVGNIQLTNLDLQLQAAQYHIFIGDKNYWGKGIAKLATFQILNYAKEILNLKEIYLHVKTNNTNAIEVYKKTGFVKLNQSEDDLQMVCFLDNIPNPTVSIFCMVYNHEKFISECLNGFLLQKCNFNFIIVIGEDCSKDDSRKIILEYVANYPGKFKLLLHDKNIGAHKNQQIVLENCKGKYIALCEGDDYWTDPLKLQKQVDFLEANEEYVVCGHDAKIINNEGEIIKISKLPEEFKRDANSMELQNGFWILTLSMVFRNMNIFKNVPKEFFKVSNGDIFLISMLGQFGDYKYMNSIQPAVYRIHDGGIWSLRNEDYKNLENLKTKTMMAIYYQNIDKNVAKIIFSNNFKNSDKLFLRILNTKSSLLYKIKLIKLCLFNCYKANGIFKSIPFFIKRIGRLTITIVTYKK
jgi:RimJ/RimL family protein N-acetyltransferase